MHGDTQNLAGTQEHGIAGIYNRVKGTPTCSTLPPDEQLKILLSIRRSESRTA